MDTVYNLQFPTPNLLVVASDGSLALSAWNSVYLISPLGHNGAVTYYFKTSSVYSAQVHLGSDKTYAQIHVFYLKQAPKILLWHDL